MRWFWIDKFVEFERGKRAVTVKNVSIVEEELDQYQPGFPVFPNSLVIEGMAQTAGALSIRSFPKSGNARVVYLMTIDEAKFRRPVVPGDVVEYHIRKIRSRGNVWKFGCEAMVSGVKVAEAIITAMMAEE